MSKMGKAENPGKIVKYLTVTYQPAGIWNLCTGKRSHGEFKAGEIYSELRAEQERSTQAYSLPVLPPHCMPNTQ